MMLPGPPSSDKDQRGLAREGGLPLFLILGLRDLLFLFLVGEGLCLPYILHPPTPPPSEL